MTEIERCGWAKSDAMQRYHDDEWGTPVHDDRVFFEFLTLEGAQAGLSWETILQRREGYRAAFADFDPAQVARFDGAMIATLIADSRIIRNRAKILSTIKNAEAFLAIQSEFGSFDTYLWAFVDGKPIVTDRHAAEPVPATTALSDRISKDLKSRNFGFVGSTIIYAFLQATGVVDDHRAPCFKAV